MGNEVWANIYGCIGYEISTLGNVRSYRTRKSGLIRIFPKSVKKCYSGTKRKYEKVMLMINGKHKSFYIHRLMAHAFIPNPENKPQVNHIDNNPINNAIENLEWVTNSENQIHRFKHYGTYSNLGLYIYNNRGTYRVEKKGVVNKCFKTLSESKQFASQFY